MKSIDGIKSSIKNKDCPHTIAKKIYLSYTTEVFRGNEDAEFYIKNQISEGFDIPFSAIQVVGSGKTGLSFIKNNKFNPGKSDLDIAVISLDLYNKFCETSHQVTNGYSDLSKFKEFKGHRTDKQFINGLKRGFVNPFFMPACDTKSRWLDLFNIVSNQYFELFKNINGGIYSSEYFFVSKQSECIEEYMKNPQTYDEISGQIKRTY